MSDNTKEQQGVILAHDSPKLGSVTFSPKYHGGSLDSLKDISQPAGTNGSRNHSRRGDVICEDLSPRSSEGVYYLSTIFLCSEFLESSVLNNQSCTNCYDFNDYFVPYFTLPCSASAFRQTTLLVFFIPTFDFLISVYTIVLFSEVFLSI